MPTQSMRCTNKGRRPAYPYPVQGVNPAAVPMELSTLQARSKLAPTIFNCEEKPMLTKADRDAFAAAAVAVLAAKERTELATQQGPSASGSLGAGANEATQRLVQVMADLLRKGIAGVQFRGLL